MYENKKRTSAHFQGFLPSRLAGPLEAEIGRDDVEQNDLQALDGE